MSDDRIVKKGFLGETDGRRKAGKPKLRWLDCPENVRNRWASGDGKRKQKASLYRLSCRSRRWINFKDHMSVKKEEQDLRP